MDIWIPRTEKTAHQMVKVFRDFGVTSDVTSALFLKERAIVPMGVPPNKLEVTTYIDGVEFTDCQRNQAKVTVEDLTIFIIGLADLRRNKLASGRLKGLADLENLPPA